MFNFFKNTDPNKRKEGENLIYSKYNKDTLIYRFYVKDGKLNGKHYSYANGKVSEETEYLNDVENGIRTEFDSDGKTFRVIEVRDGILFSIIEFYPSGEKKFQKVNDKYTFYNPQGIKSLECEVIIDLSIISDNRKDPLENLQNGTHWKNLGVWTIFKEGEVNYLLDFTKPELGVNEVFIRNSLLNNSGIIRYEIQKYSLYRFLTNFAYKRKGRLPSSEIYFWDSGFMGPPGAHTWGVKSISNDFIRIEDIITLQQDYSPSIDNSFDDEKTFEDSLLDKIDGFDFTQLVYDFLVSYVTNDEYLNFLERGIESYKQGDYVQSETCFRECIRINPNIIDAFFNLGLVQYEGSDLEESHRSFVNVLSIEKNHAESWYMKGLIELKKSDFEKSIHSFTNSIKNNPESLKSYLNRGISYLLLKNYHKSLEDLNLLLGFKDSDLIENALLLQGLCFQGLSQYKESITSFTKIIESSNNHLKKDALQFRSRSYHFLDYFNEAKSDIDEVIDTFKDRTTEDLKFRANVLDNLGRNEESLKDLKECIDRDGDSVDILNMIGSNLRSLDRHEESLEILNKSLNIEKKGETYFQISLTLLELKRYDESLMNANLSLTHGDELASILIDQINQLVEKTSSDNTEYSEDSYNLKLKEAKLLVENKEFQKGISLYNSLIELNPIKSDGYLGLGLTYLLLFNADNKNETLSLGIKNLERSSELGCEESMNLLKKLRNEEDSEPSVISEQKSDNQKSSLIQLKFFRFILDLFWSFNKHVLELYPSNIQECLNDIDNPNINEELVNLALKDEPINRDQARIFYLKMKRKDGKEFSDFVINLIYLSIKKSKIETSEMSLGQWILLSLILSKHHDIDTGPHLSEMEKKFGIPNFPLLRIHMEIYLMSDQADLSLINWCNQESLSGRTPIIENFPGK